MKFILIATAAIVTVLGAPQSYASGIQSNYRNWDIYAQQVAQEASQGQTENSSGNQGQENSSNGGYGQNSGSAGTSGY
ncbi:hypothetical protein DSO57_1012919 [Entomophthora muscae]|uniref:Uncharacterized protein n=1 Tax=Entomophthora muscae TaxID=34485 RepID=A0ACC2T5S4_9FUNG|nr:hypothetical protein DSO57_1012919 [Entomophthora muscae]